MLKWNVFYENFNKKKIGVYNIFDHASFYNHIVKANEKFGTNKKMFIEEVKIGLRFYFWAKCEWEIILSDWPESKNFKSKKIDVYDQIMLNWEVFEDYIWNNKDNLSDKT